MKIHLKTTVDIETGKVLEDISFDYFGPIAEAKKGKKRKREEEQAQKRLREQAERDAELARQRQAEQLAILNRVLAPFESVGPGNLNEFQRGGYWTALDDISRTYGSLREAGLRSLNRAGFGRAPSGFRSSYMSTSQRGESQDKARALWNALQATGEDLKYAAGQRAGLTGLFGGETRSSTGQASDISQRRFSMDQPSTFNRIMSGIGTVGSIVAAPFTGGTSLIGLAGSGLKNIFRPTPNLTPAPSVSSGGWGGGGSY